MNGWFVSWVQAIRVLKIMIALMASAKMAFVVKMSALAVLRMRGAARKNAKSKKGLDLGTACSPSMILMFETLFGLKCISVLIFNIASRVLANKIV